MNNSPCPRCGYLPPVEEPENQKPTHYATRDLHSAEPGDFEYPAWDVLALIEGKVYYSEDIYDTLREAQMGVEDLRAGRVTWGWLDNPVPNVCEFKPRWVSASSTR